MDILQYSFFQHALLGALLISICCGIIGTYVVTRRRVFIAGGITHASMGGLGLGIFLGINPTVTAIAFAIVTAVLVQWTSKQKNVREDSAIAVSWSLGMALGIIFIFLTPGYAPSLSEYLFGNILTISAMDLINTSVFTVFLVGFTVLCFRPIIYTAFDPEFAKLQGIRSEGIEYCMTILTAITIVLSIRLIGIVLLLSVLTLPQMMSSLLFKDYKWQLLTSCLIGLVGCITGLLLSYWLNVPVGACIVTLLVVAFLLMKWADDFLQKRKLSSKLTLIASLMACGAMLSGCASSNTALGRKYRGMTTKFNVYFNGNEAYRNGLASLEKGEGTVYSQRLTLHPIDEYALSKEEKTNNTFDGAIEKCQKCIATKSLTQKPKKQSGKGNDPAYKEFMSRGEYNPYIHNAWLLLGKSQFYKGDFNAAQATFSYTARHFKWKPLVVAAAHIWAARCYAVQGYVHDAQAELDLVVASKKYQDQATLSALPEYRYLTRQLQQEFSLVLAEMALHQPQAESQAIPYLKNARRAFQTKEQRIRTDYLMAQLLEEQQQWDAAYQSYSRIARRAKDYKTQFNAKIASTRVMPQTNLKSIEKKLRRMRIDSRNREYLDQIYYALGNVELARRDTVAAIVNYEKALSESTRNGMDKAIAALKLGAVTFEREDYVAAQRAYSTAMSILPATYPDYKQLSQLSTVLDELQTLAESVQLQDSLLRLSQLPEAELQKVVEQLIKDLKKKEKEEADAAAIANYESKKSATVDPLAQKQTQQTVGVKDNSWYFYNTATINFGKTEFQRLWGSRKLEDNWRRKNKNEVLTAMSSEGDEASLNNEVLGDASTPNEADSPAAADVPAADSTATPAIDPDKASDPHNPEYYYAQIPKTPEDKANSNQIIEDGTYNMGVIINEKLENFPLAIKTLLGVVQRYPDTQYRLDCYYAIYLMYMRMDQPAQAEVYRSQILSAFPESAYAKALGDAHYIEHLKAMAQGQDSLYTETYMAYLDGRTDFVHERYNYVNNAWPLCPLMPKFLFLHALSYVQEGNIDAFKEALDQLTALYPSSDVSPLAGAMVKGIREGRQVQTGDAPKGIRWNLSLKSAEGEAGEGEAAAFVYDTQVPYLLLLTYSPDSISQNDLLFEVAQFNFDNYLVKDFDLEIITTEGLSLLVIRGFENLDDVLDYQAKMDYPATGLQLPSQIEPITISEANFRALLQGKTFQEYFDFLEQQETPQQESQDSHQESQVTEP